MRKNKMIERMTPEIEKMKEPHFLTLTVRSRRLSRENIRTLRRNFTKLRHRPVWISVFGGFYNIELGTLRKDGVCNMHIHVLYDGVDINQAYLSWLWYQVTGDSFIVDIRNCWNTQGALHYISKHFCKIGSFEGEESRTLINKSLKNTRMVQGFGKHRRLPVRGPTICPECHAEGSFYTSHESLYYDIISSFETLEYDRGAAIAL